MLSAKGHRLLLQVISFHHLLYLLDNVSNILDSCLMQSSFSVQPRGIQFGANLNFGLICEF